jgi:hypothetical protein
MVGASPFAELKRIWLTFEIGRKGDRPPLEIGAAFLDPWHKLEAVYLVRDGGSLIVSKFIPMVKRWRLNLATPCVSQRLVTS